MYELGSLYVIYSMDYQGYGKLNSMIDDVLPLFNEAGLHGLMY
jgi:hypothetical protein